MYASIPYKIQQEIMLDLKNGWFFRTTKLRLSYGMSVVDLTVSITCIIRKNVLYNNCIRMWSFPYRPIQDVDVKYFITI